MSRQKLLIDSVKSVIGLEDLSERLGTQIVVNTYGSQLCDRVWFLVCCLRLLGAKIPEKPRRHGNWRPSRTPSSPGENEAPLSVRGRGGGGGKGEEEEEHEEETRSRRSNLVSAIGLCVWLLVSSRAANSWPHLPFFRTLTSLLATEQHPLLSVHS